METKDNFAPQGFDLPVDHYQDWLRLYKEYHNSLDNKDFFFSSNTLIESLKKYYELILTIDTNFIPISKICMELIK